MSSHFKIIVPFYNVEEWVKVCIRSVKLQSYKDFQCILIDDISTDGSVEIVEKEIANDDRFMLVRNTEKAYALKNIYDAIALSEPHEEDIIVTLDGDDWLANKDVLNKLNSIYTQSSCWLTYGSYAEYPNGARGKFAKKIPAHVMQNNLYRESEWCSSHLRTFKHHLWSRIKKEDLLDNNGDFYKMAWDLAFMFPMLEMAGDKSKYINDILYIYNLGNPLNDHKVDGRLQQSLEFNIRNKDKYNKIGLDPATLLTPLRFDIAAKTAYAKSLLRQDKSSFAKRMYLQHIKVWNNFCEQDPPKEGRESFLNSFHETLFSVRDNGFKKKGAIPVFNGSPLNGAHRAASCIALQDVFTLTLLPSHEIPIEHLCNEIKKRYDIVYSKEVELNETGKNNYIHNLYYNEPWIGPKHAGYPGVLEKSSYCFSHGDTIKVFLLEEDNIENLINLKKTLRDICGVGKHSVHINDTQEETCLQQE